MSNENFKASDLHRDLVDLFTAVKSGAIGIKQAKEMNNCAGKIIALARTQVEYAVVRDERPNIPFLTSVETPE